jgi:hypothetical protein
VRFEPEHRQAVVVVRRRRAREAGVLKRDRRGGHRFQVPNAAFAALWNCAAVTPGASALELNQRTGV